MVEYSKANVKLSDKQLKKLKTVVKKNRKYFKEEFENVWWNWSASWIIIIDNKAKKEAKKCI